MNPIRALATMAIFLMTILFSNKAIDTDIMSMQEQKETGIAETQKKELENSVQHKFILKTSDTSTMFQQYHLQRNLESGRRLELSDGSIYEVDPRDRSQTAFWLSPIIVKIDSSDDPDYPYKITNIHSHASVKAKKIKDAD